MDEIDYDLLILGGGLAGLTAALHAHQAAPSARIAVVERQTFPVAEAAHKVGESSVEIGAHYFAETLGQRDHIVAEQLPKLGLRYFFGSASPERLETRCEMGGNDFLPSRSYQLDRGRFENHLARQVRARGITILDGQRVRELALAEGSEAHRVSISTGGRDGERYSLQVGFIADASGRAGILKRHCGLAEESPHRAHAVWFRINESLRIDDEISDPALLERHGHRGQRWLSTVHLMGAGYWVWFIPLASGSTSVGIVIDADLHRYDDIKDFDRASAWLAEHEPLAARMVAAHADKLMDFAGYRRYSYGCKQLYSDRWALLGEAGFFLDPFYSPGSDFIAMGNTVAVDLFTRYLAGESGLAQRAAFMDGILHSLFDNHLAIYHRQYPLFANAKVMATKVVWDFAYYWAVPATLFFHGQLTNTTLYARSREALEAVAALGGEVQEFFRRWHALDSDPYAGTYVDVPQLPLMAELNTGLLDTLDAAATIARLRAHAALLHEVAAELRDYVQDLEPTLDCSDLQQLTACARAPEDRLRPLWQGLGLPCAVG